MFGNEYGFFVEDAGTVPVNSRVQLFDPRTVFLHLRQVIKYMMFFDMQESW